MNMMRKNVNVGPSSNSTSYIIFFVMLTVFIGTMVYFQNEISNAWNNASDLISAYFTKSSLLTSNDVSGVPAPAPAHEDVPSANLVEKVLPGSSNLSGPAEPAMGSGATQVYNISANRYTYYDAEPLCKAMGAELATYDQVKEAWSKGADWCNYGWVKGQMAVYPTSAETYKKLQQGSAEDSASCGRAGLNGGYFDNPEMRFGVTCYGPKPAKDNHDETHVSQGAPQSPDAVAFNRKVAKFKAEVDSVPILPFSGNKW